jgi:hypothetical protein
VVLVTPPRLLLQSPRRYCLSSKGIRIIFPDKTSVNVSSSSQNRIHLRILPCANVHLLALDHFPKVFRRLNTFLELKMENERLQQRLTDLKARTGAVSLAGSIAHQAPYPVSSLIPTHEQAVSVPSQPLTVMPGTGYHRMSNTSDDMRPDAGPVPCTAADGQSGDDGSEQGRKKKVYCI